MHCHRSSYRYYKISHYWVLLSLLSWCIWDSHLLTNQIWRTVPNSIAFFSRRKISCLALYASFNYHNFFRCKLACSLCSNFLLDIMVTFTWYCFTKVARAFSVELSSLLRINHTPSTVLFFYCEQFVQSCYSLFPSRTRILKVERVAICTVRVHLGYTWRLPVVARRTTCLAQRILLFFMATTMPFTTLIKRIV